MASLTTIFKNEANGGREQDKLVDLFRNRAELKKAFAALRDEKFELQDRLRQRTGDTARAEQQLKHLENLLLDPDWVLNIAVFYQLRSLAGRYAEALESFAEQLKQQHEKHRQSELLDTWGRHRHEKSTVVDRKINTHRMAMQALEDQLESERHRLKSMGTVRKWFGGRAVAREIRDVSARIGAGKEQEEEMLKERRSIEDAEPPSQYGLDVATKRSINLKILSFAQQLYLQFDDENLLRLATEATGKGVGSVKYGSRLECAHILAALDNHGRDDRFPTTDVDVLKQRLQLISKCAEYRGIEDTIPVPTSVASVFAIDAEGEVAEKDVDILGDNYFDIARILSR